VLTVDGPPNQAIALRGGLPRRPGARARPGPEPGRGLARLGVRPDLVGRPLAELAVRDHVLRFAGMLGGEGFVAGPTVSRSWSSPTTACAA